MSNFMTIVGNDFGIWNICMIGSIKGISMRWDVDLDTNVLGGLWHVFLGMCPVALDVEVEAFE